MTPNKDNPFYNNYVFGEYDIERATLDLSLIEKIRLFFKPAYVQTNDGYVFKFKCLDNKWYLLEIRKLNDIK